MFNANYCSTQTSDDEFTNPKPNLNLSRDSIRNGSRNPTRYSPWGHSSVSNNPQSGGGQRVLNSCGGGQGVGNRRASLSGGQEVPNSRGGGQGVQSSRGGGQPTQGNVRLNLPHTSTSRTFGSGWSRSTESSW
jgi:hypothetical protein